MLLFRSLALGLLGAIFFLLATRPTTIVVRQPQPIEVPNLSGIRGVPAPPGPTLIDVARGVDWTLLPSLVHLGEGEHVATIDDMPIANDLDAGRVLAAKWTERDDLGYGVGLLRSPDQPPRVIELQRYVDLEVRGPRGDRRVLLLMH